MSIAAIFLAGIVSASPGTEPAFDQPIDPDIYLIRPGDMLTVTFIKTKIDSLTLAVNVEGRIVDATLGIIDLSAATLTTARRILVDSLKKLYNVDQIAVSITKPRQVSINVTGAVREPGLYSGASCQRVSELLEEAGGVAADGCRRGITFAGGPREITVDLDRAIITGDNAYNPCLYAGRRIHVPYRSDSVVQVVGEVNDPREIELLAGDDLELLVALAGGFTRRADTAGIEVMSFRNGNKSELRPGDVIFVPALEATPESTFVSVFGAVEKPGIYGYWAEMTLRGLLDTAGGFADRAAVEQTAVFRKADIDEWGNPTDLSYPIANVAVSPDGPAAFLIKPFDSIFVPLQTGFVKVQGEVINPGLFPYVKGKDALYYIIAAGGFTPSADRQNIQKFDRVARTTAVHSSAVKIHDGEVIIVERREELR